MDLEKDIHCFICFGVLPFGDIHRPFPQNPGFLEKFFQVNSQQFLADSLLCSKCDSHLTSMVDTSVKIQELQETLETLKAEFERNLIGGFELSQKTQKDINRRLGTNYEPGETLDTFYAGRCALVKDLNLIPTIISKIETNFQSEEFVFEDFEEVPSPAYEKPLDPQEDLTPDLIVSQPIIGLKEAIVSLPRLDLPPNQTSFNLNDLKSSQELKILATQSKLKRGRPRKGEIRISRSKRVKRPPGRPRKNDDETYIKKKSYYEIYKAKNLMASPMSCTFEGCLYQSRFKARIKRHIRLMHMKGVPKPEYKCPTCGFVAKWKSRLLIHQRTHENVPSICDFCGKSYRNESSLKMHVSEQHTDPKSFLCSYCPKAFTSKGRLNLHLKTHTRERLVCEFCGRDFAQRQTLVEHRQKEHEGKGVKCEICQRVMVNKSSYDVHMKYHLNIYDYQCPECPKGYNSKFDLNSHISVIHRGERNYQCEFCLKRFGRKEYLKKHIKITHKKEKEYSCPVCLKSFFRIDTLRRHEEIHRSTKYFCPICKAIFNTPKYLNQHVTKTGCKDNFKIWKEAKGASSTMSLLKDLVATPEILEKMTREEAEIGKRRKGRKGGEYSNIGGNPENVD